MRILNPEKGFTRPADITAYASGDLVANSTTVADVVALKFATGTSPKEGLMIRRARLRKSGTSTMNASFRLHLFSNKPTPTTNGDNGALEVSDTPGYLGSFDFTLSTAFTDGAVGFAAPAVGSEILAAVDGAIFGILEARAAYTPSSGEVFKVQLEVVQE